MDPSFSKSGSNEDRLGTADTHHYDKLTPSSDEEEVAALFQMNFIRVGQSRRKTRKYSRAPKHRLRRRLRDIFILANYQAVSGNQFARWNVFRWCVRRPHGDVPPPPPP